MAEGGYIKSLDGVRAVAILLVMTFHAELTRFGWMGVQLFFVLSGFLIIGILWKDKSAPGPLGDKFRNFWIRRSLRIFPLYFGYIFLMGITYLVLHSPSVLPQYLPYLLTYTFNYSLHLPTAQGPSFTFLWSLSIEEQFYLLFPLIIFFCPPRFIRALMVTTIAAAPLIRYGLGEYYRYKGYSPELIVNNVYFNTLSHVDAFFLGGVIPVFALHRRVRSPQTLFLLSLAAAFGAGLWNYCTQDHAGHYAADLGYAHGLQYTGNNIHIWQYTFLNLAFASLLLVLVSDNAGGRFSWLRRLMENEWLVRIGKVSYGMYIFHAGMMHFIYEHIPANTILVKSLLFIPYVLLVYLLATLSFRFYESPFIKLKESLTRKYTAKKGALIVLLLILFSANARSQVIAKVGCGEYGRYVLRASDGFIYEDWWDGHKVALTATNTNGRKIVDIAGALYTAVGVDEDGYAWVFGQGSITPVKIATDTTGKPFTGNISCVGYFGTYATLKEDGTIWIWGRDAWALFSDLGSATLSRPVKLKMPPGVKFKKIRAGNKLVALASNGAVYEYSGNKGVPAKVVLPRPASDIAASHTGFYIAIVPDNIQRSKMGYPYGWGAESVYFGATGSIAIPIPLKGSWGLRTPIRKIVANHNTIHFIDSLGRLFGMGDNPNGEIGNGEELVNHAERYRTPYAWSWTKHEYLVSKPVQIGVGITWKDIWCDNSYAFYHFAVDRNDSLYFWGRAKSWVSGKGHNNEDIFPNAFDVLQPTMLHPFTTPNRGYGPFIKYTCSAGKDQSVTGDTALLEGNATPSTGYTIASLKWTKVSGPSCIIDSPDAGSTVVRKLSKGTYLFSLKMTDNNTATITDTVAIKVGGPPGPQQSAR